MTTLYPQTENGGRIAPAQRCGDCHGDGFKYNTHAGAFDECHWCNRTGYNSNRLQRLNARRPRTQREMAALYHRLP